MFRKIEKGAFGRSVPVTGCAAALRVNTAGQMLILRIGADAATDAGFRAGGIVDFLIGEGDDAGLCRVTSSNDGWTLKDWNAKKPNGVLRLELPVRWDLGYDDRDPQRPCDWRLLDDGRGLEITLPHWAHPDTDDIADAAE